jgi:positive regulator of sigma E activity
MMKRVLLKTTLILMVPVLAGLIIGKLIDSILPIATGATIGIAAFIWISLVKLRHLARAFKNSQAGQIGKSKNW